MKGAGAIFLFLALAVLPAIANSNAWNECRSQYDASIVACINDAQCTSCIGAECTPGEPHRKCDLLTGLCTHHGATEFATLEYNRARYLSEIQRTVACANSSLPSVLWELHFGLELPTNHTLLVIPLPGPINNGTACHWDPRAARSSGGCTDSPHMAYHARGGFCGKRWAGSGRCTPVGSPGYCSAHIAQPSYCKAIGGEPTGNGGTTCLFPSRGSQEECLNHICAPGHQAEGASSVSCPKYCWDRARVTKLNCEKHVSDWRTSKLHGWDPIAKKCRVNCATCMQSMESKTQVASTSSGSCDLSDEWTWHYATYHTPAQCSGAGTVEALPPPDTWEQCSLRMRSPAMASCEDQVSRYPKRAGCVGPYITGPSAIPVGNDSLSLWLPDAGVPCPEGATWQEWSLGDTADLVPATPQSDRPEWCSLSPLQEIALPASFQHAAAAWAAASIIGQNVVSVLTAPSRRDNTYTHAIYTAKEGSIHPEGLPFGIYWLKEVSPNLFFVEITAMSETTAELYRIKVTRGWERADPWEQHTNDIMFCGPKEPINEPSRRHLSGKGYCVTLKALIPHLLSWTTRAEVTEARKKALAPAVQTPSREVVTEPYFQTTEPGACARPGYIPPACTHRVCGDFTDEDQEIRGVAEGDNGQCMCHHPWAGPECNHCAHPHMPETTVPHTYICAQLPKVVGGPHHYVGSDVWAAIPIPLSHLDDWVAGTVGVLGYPGLYNRPAGTDGFDCRCRHYRAEYDIAFGTADEMHARLGSRNHRLALPLNVTETNITITCLAGQGFSQEQQDLALALLTGVMPAGINCSGKLGFAGNLLLIVACVMIAVGVLFCLISRFGPNTRATYQEMLSEEEADELSTGDPFVPDPGYSTPDEPQRITRSIGMRGHPSYRRPIRAGSGQ